MSAVSKAEYAILAAAAYGDYPARPGDVTPRGWTGVDCTPAGFDTDVFH
jgi:hypothetical protein